MELVEKNIQSNHFCILDFKKEEERLTMAIIILKTQIEYLEMKSTTSEIKNILNGFIDIM